MKDLDALFTGLLGVGLGRRRGLLGGLAGGLLGSLLFRRNQRSLGRVAKLGALAAIGSLAYRAWNEARDGRPPAEPARPRRVVRDETVVVSSEVTPEEALPPPDSGFLPRDEAEAEALGLLLLRAMVAAAHADGRLDAEESARLEQQLEALDLEGEDAALLRAELQGPASIEDLVRATRTPEQGAEVYAASLLAIEVDSALERSHLRRLQRALDLDPAVAERLEAELIDA